MNSGNPRLPKSVWEL